MHERPLRVFYNASALPVRPAGAGVYTLELGAELALREDIQLFAAAPSPYAIGDHPIVSSYRRRARQAWEVLALRAAMARVRPDVYHGPHFYTPRTSVPTVSTVHDLTFFRLPARYGFVHRRYYRFLAGAAKRADRIIVPSGAVAADVVRYLGFPPERVRVIAEAPRSGFVPASEEEIAACRREFDLPGPYLLCLGTAEPGKRAVDAVRAMPAILESARGTVLALAGNEGPLSAGLRREAQRLGVGDAVRFLGYVEDRQVPPLLTGAAALIFPSLFEGFGLPPLEAMACGTPIITTMAPAMSEVLRGSGAAFVPLRDPGAIAKEAAGLLGDARLRAERSARGLEFVSRFSWSRAAAETAEVYREVAG